MCPFPRAPVTSRWWAYGSTGDVCTCRLTAPTPDQTDKGSVIILKPVDTVVDTVGTVDTVRDTVDMVGDRVDTVGDMPDTVVTVCDPVATVGDTGCDGWRHRLRRLATQLPLVNTVHTGIPFRLIVVSAQQLLPIPNGPAPIL